MSAPDLMAALRASLPPRPARRRRVPSQCLGCGRFVGPASTAWPNGYHPECDPSRPEYDRTVRGAR